MEDTLNEEETIKYYFNQGFEFKEILLFLKTYHNLEISMRTLLRRLQLYGLKRRCCETEGELRIKHFRMKNRIKEMLYEPGSVGGYRTVWHSLEMEGMRVPRVVVQYLLKELDPIGTETRRNHRLKRRKYEKRLS